QVGRGAVRGRLQLLRGERNSRRQGRRALPRRDPRRRRQPPRRRVVPRVPRPRAERRRAAQAQRHDRGVTLRLAAWNVNSLKVRLPHLLDWLARARPDVTCLQETKTEDRNFPLAEIEAAGYRVAYSGQKTYNGVAILSRAQIAEEARGIPGFADDP